MNWQSFFNSKLKKKATNFTLFLISAALSLLMAEFVLRAVSPHNLYKSLVPLERKAVYNPYTSIYKGIDSISYQSVNQWGYRSPSQFQSDRYGILTIGGSTTYCNGLSDEESWPWLLEKHLNEQGSADVFTVGNVGVPTFDSFHNAYQLEYIAPQFENIKMVVMLMGINDYFVGMYLNEKFTGNSQNPHAFKRTFIRLPRKAGARWYERTETWMHLRDLRNFIRHNKNEEPSLQEHRENIQKYLDAEKIDRLPDITLGLEDYEANLRRIAKLARAQNLQLVWLTQPSLWHDGMPEEYQPLVASGSPIVKGKSFTALVSAQAMQLYNERMMTVAQEEGVILIDLATKIPKSTDYLFDNCHYTKAGSKEVANVVFGKLKGYLTTEAF